MSDLERMTVNLIPQSVTDLAEACELTGLNRTDTVNRALRLYAYVMRLSADGGKLMTERNGDLEVIHLL
jgi:hypothetical protein